MVNNWNNGRSGSFGIQQRENTVGGGGITRRLTRAKYDIVVVRFFFCYRETSYVRVAPTHGAYVSTIIIIGEMTENGTFIRYRFTKFDAS